MFRLRRTRTTGDDTFGFFRLTLRCCEDVCGLEEWSSGWSDGSGKYLSTLILSKTTEHFFIWASNCSVVGLEPVVNYEKNTINILSLDPEQIAIVPIKKQWNSINLFLSLASPLVASSLVLNYYFWQTQRHLFGEPKYLSWAKSMLSDKRIAGDITKCS